MPRIVSPLPSRVADAAGRRLDARQTYSPCSPARERRTDDGQTELTGGATEPNFDDVAEERERGGATKEESEKRGDRFRPKMWRHEEGGEKPDNRDNFV